MSYAGDMADVSEMSLPTRRVAAYGVCIENGRVLLALHVPHTGGDGTWTLPGGGVEHGEDPFDTVVREVAEETGCAAVVERLLGVDSRVIGSADRRPGLPEHQNLGIYYQVRLTAGEPRPEPGGEIVASMWASLYEVTSLRRSSLVDVGIALATTLPATGHVDAVAVGGLVQH